VTYGEGTPCYVPPKGVYGELSKSRDIWAFGVTLLYIARLISLFNRSWIIANIRTDDTAAFEMGNWLSHVRNTLEKIPKRFNLIREMLEKDPGNRITAGDLVRDLRSVERGKLS